MRQPDVDPDLIREVLASGPEGERPTTTEAAKIITARLGRPVSRSLVKAALQRHGWDDVPKGRTGRPRVTTYQVERDLGPIEHRHKRSHHWLKLAAYERLVTGRSNGGRFAEAARAYVETRKREVMPTDYSPDHGFYVRPGWPWEVGCHYRQPVPEGARALVELALKLRSETDNPVAKWVTEEHVAYWQRHWGELPE